MSKKRTVLRRLFATLLLTFGLFLLAGIASLGFINDYVMQAKIDAQHGQLKSLRHQASKLGHARDYVSSANRIEKSRPLLLPKISSGSAAAFLQSKLLQMIDRADGKAGMIRILPSRTHGALKRMTVAVDIKTDISGLQTLLLELETGNPLMFVDQLEITGTTQDIKNISADQKRARRLLSVNLHISSFMPRGES